MLSSSSVFGTYVSTSSSESSRRVGRFVTTATRANELDSTAGTFTGRLTDASAGRFTASDLSHALRASRTFARTETGSLRAVGVN